jgi:hypothetical protein
VQQDVVGLGRLTSVDDTSPAVDETLLCDSKDLISPLPKNMFFLSIVSFMRRLQPQL